MHSSVLFGAVLFGTLVPMVLAAQDSVYENRTIERIDFPTDQPLQLQELHDVLSAAGIKEKAPLHLASVRTAIKALFETGRFVDVQADAQSSTSGVVLRFLTQNAWFVGDVNVEGKVGDSPNRGQLVNATRLDLGLPYDEATLGPAEEAMKKLLEANGFYEATITHHVEKTNIAQQVNITFDVDTGKRAHYSPPVISGAQELTPSQVIRATKWRRLLRPGYQNVTQRRTRQGVENLRVRYQKADRLLATVELDGLDYDPKQRTVTPALSVNEGPKVSLKVDGYKIRKGKVKSSVPIYEEHAVDRDLLMEGARNLREALQSAGYFDAEVEYQDSEVVNGKEEITYSITPGDRHRVEQINLIGNKYFTKDTLRERMFLQTHSFQFRHGRYSDDFVRRDRESVANLYRSNGFRDVTVTSSTEDDFQGKTGDLAVTLTINEGAQWLVGALEVTGQKKLDLQQILPTLNSSEAQPFSEFNIASDRETILNHYFENGFPNATFEWSSTPAEKDNTVALHYQIHEGKQEFVRQVVYTGQETAKDKLINKQILLGPGDPLSPIKMAETQRRLYDLGIFAEVNMAVQNAAGAEERKYVLYDMEEASRYSISGGLGAEIARIGGSNAQEDLSSPAGGAGFSPRVSFDVSRIDFMGMGNTLALRTKYSTIESRVLLEYIAPRVFRGMDMTLSGAYDDSHDVRTFSAKREEVAAQITDRISKPTTVSLRFSYRNVQVGALKIDPALLPHLSQQVRTGVLSFNYVQDRRDDPTDAHRGVYNTVDAGLAGRYFGGQNDFVRILARNSTYHRIGKKLLLARQISFGIAPSFKLNTTDDTTDPLPLPERFYGGGTDSHRGFPENQAGPRDLKTGFPLGGSTLLFNKTELRFPLMGDNLGGVLFEDFGNIFAKASDISFRVKQPHPDDPTDFAYMVHAVGFGIRYRTPIGPVRVDLAYALNPPKFNGFKGTFQDLVNCTAANNCVSALQQVNHFQFFFSIGQAF